MIITDDNDDLRELLGMVARKDGWDVVTCRCASDLIDNMQLSDTPVLVLLDINMDKKDGIEAIEDFRGLKRPFRLCFMTGGEVSSAVAAAMIARARGINVGRTLFKPFSMARFREEILAEEKLLLD